MPHTPKAPLDPAAKAASQLQSERPKNPKGSDPASLHPSKGGAKPGGLPGKPIPLPGKLRGR